MENGLILLYIYHLCPMSIKICTDMMGGSKVGWMVCKAYPDIRWRMENLTTDMSDQLFVVFAAIESETAWWGGNLKPSETFRQTEEQS